MRFFRCLSRSSLTFLTLSCFSCRAEFDRRLRRSFSRAFRLSIVGVELRLPPSGVLVPFDSRALEDPGRESAGFTGGDTLGRREPNPKPPLSSGDARKPFADAGREPAPDFALLSGGERCFEALPREAAFGVRARFFESFSPEPDGFGRATRRGMVTEPRNLGVDGLSFGERGDLRGRVPERRLAAAMRERGVVGDERGTRAFRCSGNFFSTARRDPTLMRRLLDGRGERLLDARDPEGDGRELNGVVGFVPRRFERIPRGDFGIDLERFDPFFVFGVVREAAFEVLEAFGDFSLANDETSFRCTDDGELASASLRASLNA